MSRAIDWPAFSFGLLLLLLSAVLVAIHWRKRSRPGSVVPTVELDFRRRQFRRRMQTSLMVGVAGVLLSTGSLLPGSIWSLICGLILLSLVGWIVLLALADLAATRHHYQQVHMTDLIDEMRRPSQTPPNAPRWDESGRGAD